MLGESSHAPREEPIICGITGILRLDGHPADEALVRRMTDRLRHRGPDNQAVWCEGTVGLGHTRLSIIDVSADANQPMTSGDGRWTMVYNGEMYNFPEVRVALESKGVPLRTGSDSEVFLETWATHGPDAVARCHGMFAAALWDRRERRLWLVRDRLGIKPLFMSHGARSLTFGSEIKAVLESGEASTRVDPAGLREFLEFGNALGQRTLFSDVIELPPGTISSFSSSGERSTRSYWSVPAIPQQDVSRGEAVERIRTTLTRAVRRHLLSDVPIATFLSGGIDSSAILALAAQEADTPITAFTAGFDYESGSDEVERASRIAREYGVSHHELRVGTGNLRDVLESLSDAHDQPFGDAANIPLHLLCRELGGQTKVVLQGDGGDELFGGYRRYALLASGRAWECVSEPAEALLSRLPQSASVRRLRRITGAFAEREVGVRMARLLTLESPNLPPTRILAPDLREICEQHDPYARYQAVAGQLPDVDAVQKMLLTDAMIQLPDTFLEKVDRPTMQHGIESRVPFLDDELVELAMGLPGSLKVTPRDKKSLLKEALRGVVPDWVLDAPKRGFDVPYGLWIRTALKPFMLEVLHDPAVVRSALFDYDSLEPLLDDDALRAPDHAFTVYKAFQLALWWTRQGAVLPGESST